MPHCPEKVHSPRCGGCVQAGNTIGPVSDTGSASSRGELAIVLHTHMPYVEGFGTWPFGEEWLWEAIATSYLPLLDVLGRAPITLSLTPVLCDQLEAPGAIERCIEFLARSGRSPTGSTSRRSARDGAEAAAVELERSAAEYAGRGASGSGSWAQTGCWRRSASTRAGRPRPPTRCCRCSSATRAPSSRSQTGIASHRRRFGAWGGGFWLPECAHASWLDEVLEEAGVACHLRRADRSLRSRRCSAPASAGDRRRTGAVADRPADDLAGVERAGLPCRRRVPRLPRADAPPSPRLGRTTARCTTTPRRSRWRPQHARDFVARVRERVAGGGRVRVRASTPSCSATGGTRESPGSRRWSRRPAGRGSR